MTEKRFTVENNNGEVCIKDKLTNKYPFAYVCETIDMTEAMIGECLECSNLLNALHEENKLVWNKIMKMESVLPLYLSCAEVRDFHSYISEETLALTKHFKKRFQE